MEVDEYTSIIRSMIQHEDTLRDQRLGWLFALNGFLFAALGFAWADAESTPLVVVLSAVGTVIAVSSATSLTSSSLAIAKLSRLGRNAGGVNNVDLPPVIALRSSERRDELKCARLERSRREFLVAALYPWRLVPWCLAAAWIAIAALRLLRG